MSHIIDCHTSDRVYKLLIMVADHGQLEGLQRERVKSLSRSEKEDSAPEAELRRPSRPRRSKVDYIVLQLSYLIYLERVI